jgi:hypothetical protein
LHRFPDGRRFGGLSQHIAEGLKNFAAALAQSEEQFVLGLNVLKASWSSLSSHWASICSVRPKISARAGALLECR